jgi:hypothetical protein
MLGVPDIFTKMSAIGYISMQTGYGRRVIERIMKELEEQGRISLERDFDHSKYVISRGDVELIIRVLRREI